MGARAPLDDPRYAEFEAYRRVIEERLESRVPSLAGAAVGAPAETPPRSRGFSRVASARWPDTTRGRPRAEATGGGLTPR